MRKGRKETKLGEIISLEYGKALKESNRDGIGWPVFGSAGVVGWNSQPLVPQGPVIVVGRKGTAGAVHWSDVPCWPIDTTYYAVPQVDANIRFLFLLLEHADLPGICAQTGVPGLNRERAYEVPVFLPPLSEQQRIVDLIAAVNDYKHACMAVAVAGASTLDSALARQFPVANEGRPVSKLLSRNIGGVWGDEPGRSEVDVRVFRSTEFTNIGELQSNRGVFRSVTARQLESRQLQPGDVLLEKSGGGPNQPVGRVVWVSELEAASVCANFVQLLTPDPSKVEPKYLFYALLWWHREGRSERFQRRTTGLRNLQTADYLAQVLKVPSRDTQREICAHLDSLNNVRDSALTVAKQADVLRRSLLTELLSGSHEIPTSYDELLST